MSDAVAEYSPPLSGEVLDPIESGNKAKKAADIICGHDFVYADWDPERQEAFHRFVLEVLEAEWL